MYARVNCSPPDAARQSAASKRSTKSSKHTTVVEVAPAPEPAPAPAPAPEPEVIDTAAEDRFAERVRAAESAALEAARKHPLSNRPRVFMEFGIDGKLAGQLVIEVRVS